MSRKKSIRKYLAFLIVVAVLAGAGTYVWHAEGEIPSARGLPEQESISPGTKMKVQVTDAKSGLRWVRVQAVQNGNVQVLAHQEFQEPVREWTRKVSLSQAGFDDGQVRIEVQARDRSWRNWLKGNLLQHSAAYELDSKPPRIVLESFRHNLRQGGSGAVAFRVSEPVQRAGVQIQDFFFPAYAQSGDLYLCFFSFPFSLSPDQGQLLATATDRAGNVQEAGFHHYVNPAGFDQSRLPVTDRFLQNVIVNFQDAFPSQESLLDVFLKVNQEMRADNRRQLQEIGRKTASSPLWSGRFLRQPNASREANFGTHRMYVYRGEVVDEQTHLGIDLASVARAQVPAANSGHVVYADWLGIYGQVVIIDHGLGLQSLYAHLSQIHVQQGDRVTKGQIIGRTGSTGLAGGDHLHFGMVISGVPVNPVEWWDASWLANNIFSKLNLVRDLAGEGQK
jgi:murein DD-endopeptidase MepM/ murein hydrolase activator NlpD